jgi:hypothetical protein
MRVNSSFKGVFNKPLTVGSGIPIAIGIVLLTICFVATSFTTRFNRDVLAKQVNLIMRQIGDRLLLQSGDSTSRVLPVTEIKKGTFLLEFENEFVFSHDSLMMLTLGSFPRTEFPSGYTVTVHDCMNGSIVYGFQINNTSPDILACRGRRQPPGCYTIEIAFPDLYENVEQQKADIDQPTEDLKSLRVDPQEANPIPIAIGTEESKTTTSDHDGDQLTEELKTFKVDPQELNPIPIAIGTDEFKTTTSDFPLINLVYIGMLVLLSVALLSRHFGKRLVPLQVQDNGHSIIIKESVAEVSALGKFLFDVKDQRLLLGSEMISLTDKECRILELLNKNFGELIPRETLMQKVWIDEGVITGRSLDMFVSKLRKKLSSDPGLRITNVHGKGYKLEIPGMRKV